jgi:hypothetical protein
VAKVSGRHEENQIALALHAGTFAKYCASATMRAVFLVGVAANSVGLMMMFSSLRPGRIAQRLSLGVSRMRNGNHRQGRRSA